jgi:hypothetical protein
MSNKKYYNNIINKVQRIRAKNNKNWMDLLKLAFKYAPKDASKIMKRINTADNQISLEIKKLGKKKVD